MSWSYFCESKLIKLVDLGNKCTICIMNLVNKIVVFTGVIYLS